MNSNKIMGPKIGFLVTGHKMYWSQFPGLKEMGTGMREKFTAKLAEMGTVIESGLVDTVERAEEACELFKNEKIDILFIFPIGYTTGMMIVPVVRELHVPIRILNAHEDKSYDYKSADTALYLHHEGVCCIPEYAGTLVSFGKKFKVITGHLNDAGMWSEVQSAVLGAAAAAVFKKLNFAVIGNTYTNMTDMPTDEHRLLKATGKLLGRPEIEEIEEAYKRVTEEQLEDMYRQLRDLYLVDETVTNAHLKVSAQIAVAFDEIINKKYDISAFGYYWWGEKEEITQLRAQSALAVSRLAALGRPGVTEGDVKTAMAMKIIELMGGYGMFLEFFSMDFEEEFIMMGHDGPANTNVAEGKPRLKHLEVHHGKTGEGLGIDFDIRQGAVTLLNLTQFCEGTFKLIYTAAEVIGGDILNIGNPNCRVRVKKPIAQFIDDWCRQGPSHHIALGLGDCTDAIDTFAEAMGFEAVRV